MLSGLCFVSCQPLRQEQAIRPTLSQRYPATTALRSVSTSDVSKLINALVRDASYDFDIRQRCVNKGFIGVRFLTTPSVDFALGTPCNQAIWEFSGTEKTQRWGAVLTNSAAAIVRSVLEGPAR